MTCTRRLTPYSGLRDTTLKWPARPPVHIRGQRLVSTDTAHIQRQRAISRDSGPYPQTTRRIPGQRAVSTDMDHIRGQRPVSRDNAPYLQIGPVSRDNGLYLGMTARIPRPRAGI